MFFALLVACPTNLANDTAPVPVGCIVSEGVDDDIAWRLYSLIIFTGMAALALVAWVFSRAHQAREQVRERWRLHLEDVKSLVFM